MTDLSSVVARLERATVLDRVARPLSTRLRTRFRGSRAKDLAHGVPLGHPAHPGLVLVPAGTLLAATTLDLVPGARRARRVLVLVGLASAVPAAASGLADWSELREEQQRVGLVHATLNVSALGCFALSLAAEARGRRVRARGLRAVGAAVLAGGGFLGGHLAYRQAVGVNHVEELPFLVDPGWQHLCAVDDLPPSGTPARMSLDGVPLLVVREGDAVHVLGERCSHLAGPLADGALVTEDGRSCVRCPWHGSTFRLDDGHVVHGPATSPQPAFGVRVTEGRVEVRTPVGSPVAQAGG